MKENKMCYWFNFCPIKHFTEKNLIDKKWIENYCKSDYFRCVRRKMQERGEYHPNNMLPDGTIDEYLQ